MDKEEKHDKAETKPVAKEELAVEEELITEEPGVEVLYVATPQKTIDGTDPLVVVLTWALTFGVGKVFKGANLNKARHLLPMVAVLGAVALQAVIQASEGGALSLQSLGTALGAAGVAVLGHSQFSELKKAMSKDAGDEDPITEED